MTRPKKSSAALSTELAALETLSHKELQQRWVDLYETPCPPFMKNQLLIRALAYRIQEKTLGGLDRVTRRRLDRAAADLAVGRPVSTPLPKIKPGTRLLREWQGRTYEVIVLERGVQYREREWPSLSAVAREITGARWSGPRFFGLKGAANGNT